MKKKTNLLLLTGLTCIALAGCSGKPAATAQTEEEKTETAAATTSSAPEGTPSAETGSMENTADNEESIALELLKNYVDIDAYIQGNGYVDTNKIDNAMYDMIIDGETLSIGMSYDDVLAKGFTPTDGDFADTQTNALAYTCGFTNASGHMVELGFIGDEGKTVSEGALYLIKVDLTQSIDQIPVFDIDGINGDSSINDVTGKLGEPYYILDPAYSDYVDAGFEYTSNNSDTDLTFYFDLESGAIIIAKLEGYAQ